jgi:OmpA-OmpF porin, OOP family
LKIRITFLFIIGMVVFYTNSVNAERKPVSFSVSPLVGAFVGGYFFGNSQDALNAVIYGAGLGYDFSKRVGIEGNYGIFKTKTYSTSKSSDGHLYRLEGLFYFDPYEGIVPYLAVGVGGLNIDHAGKVEDNYLADFGAGVKINLNDKVAFRADIRDVMPSLEHNFLYTIGLSFTFGGKKKVPVVVEQQKPKSAPPPKDSDGDGVIDDNDKCPNTTAGVKVDSNGCPLDSDGDLVPDYLDKCSNTTVGVKVDSNGCPLDSDGDLVPDYLDKCPNTTAGVKVDSNGCPLDSDRDLVPDYLDKCPNTPTGAKVDSNGCPLDSDGDGVPDYLDKCPNTPKGAAVDERGCWVLKGIKFTTGKANIATGVTKILDGVVTVLKANPSVNIEVQGHTDNVGSANSNQKLSADRAQAVMKYIIKKGIAKDRLNAVGYGFNKPAVSNDTPEGRAENRRVELNPIQ